MVDLGADYSTARPGGAALKRAGVKGVGRYLAPVGDPRALEMPEYSNLKAYGIDVWLVREGAAGNMKNGRQQGINDAKVAHANLQRLGLPLDTFVYTAADFGIRPNDLATLAVCDAYQDGFNSVHGVQNTGIYGGMVIINRFRANGKAVKFWQAGATSWDYGQTGFVHLHQTTQTPPVPDSDHNYINTTDYGQVGYEAPVPVTTEQEDDEMRMLFGHRNESNDEWMIVHPDLDAGDGKQIGYLVTTDLNTAKAWARMYKNGWATKLIDVGGRYDFDVSRADYIIIQEQARVVAKAMVTGKAS